MCIMEEVYMHTLTHKQQKQPPEVLCNKMFKILLLHWVGQIRVKEKRVHQGSGVEQAITVEDMIVTDK